MSASQTANVERPTEYLNELATMCEHTGNRIGMDKQRAVLAWINHIEAENAVLRSRREPAEKYECESGASGSAVEHPDHYGGSDNPYEAIKVIDAWQLGFCLGNCLKYLCRAGRKPGADVLEDLCKAHWYLGREITNIRKEQSKP